MELRNAVMRRACKDGFSAKPEPKMFSTNAQSQITENNAMELDRNCERGHTNCRENVISPSLGVFASEVHCSLLSGDPEKKASNYFFTNFLSINWEKALRQSVLPRSRKTMVWTPSCEKRTPSLEALFWGKKVHVC